MAVKKSKQNLSIKEVNNQLLTWYRNDREIFDELMMKAEQHGIRLKQPEHGLRSDYKFISESKAKSKDIAKFIEQFKKYGSYSNYMKQEKAKFKQYLTRNPESSLKTVKEYIAARRKVDELLRYFYDNFSSGSANYIYNVVAYMDEESAIERLLWELNKHNDFSQGTSKRYLDLSDEEKDDFLSKHFG